MGRCSGLVGRRRLQAVDRVSNVIVHFLSIIFAHMISRLSTCLIYDLRQTLLPAAPQILQTLLSLLPRKLSPDALELLLTALTTYIKYLVISSLFLVEPTWSALLAAACTSAQPAHIRMLAEVWGHLLRKLKTPERQRTVWLLVSSLQGGSETEAEFAAWCVIEATRAKEAQGVYTTAIELVGLIVDAYVGEGSRETYLLLRRVLTALLHHSKAESFVGVAGVIVAALEKEMVQLEAEVKGKGKNSGAGETSEGEKRLVRAVEITIVMCAVRKGGKLTCECCRVFIRIPFICSSIATTVSSLLSMVPRILACTSVESQIRPEYRALVVAALMAGDMAAWIGPGRRALDCIWKVRTPLI